MPSICFYFQVHQPNRLKQYSFADIGTDHEYENDKLNRQILNKVADRCYIPTNALMLKLIKKHKGKFRISYSISGIALEQFEKWRPDVLKSFVDLAKTGCVEFISETYSHSLSFLFSKDEFKRQVEMHREKIQKLFKQTPTVFRNTELIYFNELAKYAEDMGFKGIIGEGVDHLLHGRTPNFLYRAPNVANIKSLLKNYRLSDDIAFRFSDKNWGEHPLTADKFASWVHSVAGNGEVINLFMDYETFGEHQWEESGIFDFLKHMPEKIFLHPDFDFLTPSEVIKRYEVHGIYDAHLPTSWADTERDLSAWLSNNMQEEAMAKIYSFEKEVKALNNPGLLAKWSSLLTSDHFYYMCTKYWSDGDVHKYFSPYNSPFDAYSYYMNAIADLENELKKMHKAPHAIKVDAAEAKPAQVQVAKKPVAATKAAEPVAKKPVAAIKAAEPVAKKHVAETKVESPLAVAKKTEVVKVAEIKKVVPPAKSIVVKKATEKTAPIKTVVKKETTVAKPIVNKAAVKKK